MDRRTFIAGTMAAGSLAVAGQGAAATRDWSGASPIRYPDPDVLVLDPRFNKYKLGNAAIERVHTGNRWAEGPAWNGAGQFLVWSDVADNVQRRWLADDGRVTTFRNPSNYTNGNTFDFEGRQITFEHGGRRVLRFEHSGAVTVLAERFDGKPFNAPNDGVVTPDGVLWFTDPGYGSMVDYEGYARPLELKEAVYRLDLATGNLRVATDAVIKPNGLCFSPDYRTLYVVDTGGDAPKPIYAFDVGSDGRLSRQRVFATMAYNGLAGGSDGVRADVDGDIWAAAGWAGEGFDGVHVFAPDGTRIGAIMLPEICSNLTFGGPRRNRLFMTASQSVYALYVETHGAHIC